MKLQIVFFLNRYPLLKRILRRVRNRIAPGRSVSDRYVSLQGTEAVSEGERLRAAWQNDELPRKQRELVEEQLLLYRSGAPVDVFDVFVDALRDLKDIKPGMSMLEIGCSSGYYSEVVEIARLPLRYEGCDYSDAFIRMARNKYPNVKFLVEDATALSYQDNSFDVVLSGCCLLHIPEYVAAIQETARVARRYAIFHRTPIVWGQPEQWYRKEAYGVATVEIHFNEQEFLALLRQNGLTLVATFSLFEDPLDDSGSLGKAVRTYVCKKY